MKGQTAIEYLMTYGWAILIILIVAAVIFTVVLPGATTPAAVSGFTNVKPTQQSYGANGDLTLTVQNLVGSQINITNIYDLDTYLSIGSPGNVIPAAGSATFTVNTGSTGATGDIYNLQIAVEYETSDGLMGNSSGTLSGQRS